MDVKPNPFSLYDFLGYFVPGAIAIYLGLIAYGHSLDPSDPLWFVELLSFDRAEIYIPFVLFAYALGHLLSLASSLTIEPYAIWAHGYPSKYLLRIAPKPLFDVDAPKTLRVFARAVTIVGILPVSLLDLLLGKLLCARDLYAKSLDEFLANVLKRQLGRLVASHDLVENAQKAPANQSDYFRFAYHYAVEHAPAHLPKMQNYVALYGFTRTLCFIAVVLFWVVAWHVVAHPFGERVMALAMSTLLAYVLFIGFVKFYRRFSLEALMAVAAVVKQPLSASGGSAESARAARSE